MVLDWKITKHGSEAQASAASGFLSLRIVRLAGPYRGYVIKVNGRKLKDRPTTVNHAIQIADAYMILPIGTLLAAMEPSGEAANSSNRIIVTGKCDRPGVTCGIKFSAETTPLGKQQYCDVCLASAPGGP